VGVIFMRGAPPSLVAQMPDQRVLSDRVKTAIKTALATVLAYGVALSMDWGHTYWAAFAVAFCGRTSPTRRTRSHADHW